MRKVSKDMKSSESLQMKKWSFMHSFFWSSCPIFKSLIKITEYCHPFNVCYRCVLIGKYICESLAQSKSKQKDTVLWLWPQGTRNCLYSEVCVDFLECYITGVMRVLQKVHGKYDGWLFWHEKSKIHTMFSKYMFSINFLKTLLTCWINPFIPIQQTSWSPETVCPSAGLLHTA